MKRCKPLSVVIGCYFHRAMIDRGVARSNNIQVISRKLSVLFETRVPLNKPWKCISLTIKLHEDSHVIFLEEQECRSRNETWANLSKISLKLQIFLENMNVNVQNSVYFFHNTFLVKITLQTKLLLLHNGKGKSRQRWKNKKLQLRIQYM